MQGSALEAVANYEVDEFAPLRPIKTLIRSATSLMGKSGYQIGNGQSRHIGAILQ